MTSKPPAWAPWALVIGYLAIIGVGVGLGELEAVPAWAAWLGTSILGVVGMLALGAAVGTATGELPRSTRD